MNRSMPCAIPQVITSAMGSFRRYPPSAVLREGACRVWSHRRIVVVLVLCVLTMNIIDSTILTLIDEERRAKAALTSPQRSRQPTVTHPSKYVILQEGIPIALEPIYRAQLYFAHIFQLLY